MFIRPKDKAKVWSKQIYPKTEMRDLDLTGFARVGLSPSLFYRLRRIYIMNAHNSTVIQF